ncbi:MAG: outer membrane lipoprotein-sorting protein [Deltaproteobacteria bacterium]|jgi:outer membrane lipoprotein-sorting protein|nr:outer membrane lipoprotein-sorting protein [Deltaproteobacteria bacterium]
MYRYKLILSITAIACVFVLMSGQKISAAKDNSGADISGLGSAIVKQAFDYYRGVASISVAEMTIHRAEWERTMKIKAWTRGVHDSLFKIISPAKDKGNGTLKKGDEMWTFNPKVNRTIKLPPSMMSQAWMGSDFSNNDLAKSDTIVKDYTHSVTDVKEKDGLKIFFIESIPHPDAPVVWGMLHFKVREDGIMLSQGFYDEDKILVKELVTTDIKMMGGKLFPAVWKISKQDEKQEYTTIKYLELEFKDSLPSRIFTRAGLKKKIR